ncbi:MAG: C25 family cysteine peptidase, partial [Chromatiaceae bacterium]
VRANSVAGTATLTANGGVGVTPANDGGGGGGAGGSVLVFARTGGLSTLNITANGANGTNADPTGVVHGPGGGGAGGVIYLSSPAGSTSVVRGVNGTTTTAAIPFGAAPGTAGAANTALAESQIPGVISGATCKATLASIAGFGATAEGGRVVLHWETAFELGTAGFHVERLEPISGDYERLNDTLLPALITSPRGGRYTFLDPDAWPRETYSYRLVEQEVWGGTRVHGPYRVTPVEPRQPLAKVASAPELPASHADQGYADPAQGYQAVPHPLVGRGAARRTLAAAPTASSTKSLVAGSAQIPVRRNHLFYASTAQLAQVLDSTEDQVRGWLRNKKLELTTVGRDVAWLPAADAAGILFYGEAIDSLYTLDNIYRVRSNQKGKVMGESAGQAPPATTADTFDDTIRVEQDLFAATVVATDPESDYWYWAGIIGGGIPGWSSRELTLPLPDVAGDGMLKVFLKGAGPGTHPVRVSINGRMLGEGTWNDLADYELRLPVTGAQLQSGDNTLEVRALGDSGNLFYLDRIEVNYRRLARAVNDSLSLKAERDGPLAVEGFSAADIGVFDITDPKRPVHVTAAAVTPGAAGQSVTFTAKQGRRYLTLTGGAIAQATPVPMTAADLGSARDRVDYLVIAPPALREAAQTLADYRQGRALDSRVVGVDEIYDSYNWGVASPHALREFLRWATQSWGVRYVVLAGTGSFDYRDLWGQGELQAPTLMTSTPFGLFGCDNCLVDFNGDGAPDVALGRIPAANEADLQAYLAKVDVYEKEAVPLPQAAAMLLADKSDPAAGYFSRDSDWVAEQLPSEANVSRIYLDQYDDIDAARSLLFAAMNQGTGWVNYLGHGGIDRFGGSQDLLTSDDMGALHSPGPLPVVSALTCAANRFEIPGYAALGEELVLDADGGAIAVWAPTGLSLNEPAVQLNRSLFDAVYQQWAPTLGEAVQQALGDNRRGDEVPAFMLRIYSLLGDPALELR